MAGPKDLSKITFFLSSTYKDLKSYRQETIEKLKSASGIICAQEFFGSRSNKALKTCLDEIDKSDVVLLFLAHWYGSIDEKTGKSFTQLEYEYATEKKKLIFAYLADEEYPWSPRFIARGVESEKLSEFKKQVKKDLTIDYFTSQEDLSSKVFQDLLRELPKHNFKIGEYIEDKSKNKVSELLTKFSIMPRLFSGREFSISVVLNSYKEAPKRDCEALNLTYGAAIRRRFKPSDDDLRKEIPSDLNYIYASGNEALELSDFQDGEQIFLNLKTKSGIYYNKKFYKKTIKQSPDGFLTSTQILSLERQVIVDDSETSEELIKGIIYLSINKKSS